ncbi:MAG: 16S rRNA (adenine(1518)-N(6)/adenine(1519)-N(6))-dimethyltransferase RsmA [Candidatus Kapaibacterium sp.]
MPTITSVRPKKSLSQNFLVDTAVARRIADSLQPMDGECVVEIGPGTGALTRYLVDRPTRLICIEKDARSVEFLRREYAARTGEGFEVREGDFLRLDFRELRGECEKGLSVIGNIPYAISSEILFKLFDNASSIRSCVLMMQREVARRLVAPTRTKEYGILTLATEMAGSAKVLFDVKPGSFFPVPGVTSSVVRFTFRNEPATTTSVDELRVLIRSAFAQRRKTLRNALDGYVRSRLGVDIRSVRSTYLDRRAEELTLEDFDHLYREVRQCAS